MLWVLIVGLLMNAIALPLAAKRVVFLYRAISHGQPAPDRIQGVTSRLGAAVKRQLVEVFGQKKMLKWTVPGTAHFFVMWAFFILGSVYVEAYAVLLSRNPEWSFLVFGNWGLLGFAQDFIGVMCLLGLVTFWAIRLRNRPDELGRRSRFFGSHLGPAYFTLFMIFNVIWTMFLFRGAVEARDMGTGRGYGKAAFVSYALGKVLPDSTALIGIGLLLHIGVMLVFLIFVLNSKHLHIFVAPLNVMFGREPVALGAAKPMTSGGKALTLDDLEDLDEESKLGVGAAEDFTWKGVLDMATCTECGRCQSQCPAWNTEKPLSPKLLMMALRDHTLAKTPYLLADDSKRESMLQGNEALQREVGRPLVGDTGDEWFYMPDDGSAAIDTDVLWSCVTCGACVQQCPVDIEHVDHIVDMRRYQVLVESNFPAELNGLFKGMEGKGNPWNMSATARMDWAKDLPFEVKVVGEDLESLDEVDWLFWVGCAGAYEDRAKKTTRAVAELLDMAGVSFGVLGNGETCTGDSARRAGNEFVFQGLAAQNIETFKEYKVKKAVTTCAHCFNTLKNEYTQLGIELEVVHHTQLLNRLVREKRLTPVASNGGGDKRSITYHDPCYLGRHNQVYSPPRELLTVIPDATFTEMPRNSERSFCCGAGGARMWMEETIGTRINDTRTKEAVETGADQIAVGCPFCRVMLSDGLTSAQSKGEAREEVEVLDVAQLLLASVKGESTRPAATARAGASAASASSGGGTATAVRERDENVAAEPEAGDTTDTENTVTSTSESSAATSGTSSLFDVGDSDSSDSAASGAEPEPEPKVEATATAADEKGGLGGGSLFDLGDSSDDEAKGEPSEETGTPPSEDSAAASEKPESTTSSGDSGGFGGSLFDVGDDKDSAPGPEAKQEPEAEPEATTTKEPAPASSGSTSTPASEIPEGGSLFDIAEPEEQAPAEPVAEEQVDRSQDAADPDVAPDEEQDEPEVHAETAQAAPASSGGGITPASEIPEGGSLFDIAEPEDQSVAAPAASTAAPADEDVEQETAEQARAEETAAEQEPEPEPAPEPAPESSAASDAAPESEDADAPAGGLGGQYPPGRSMFDVPDTGAPAEPTATAESGPGAASGSGSGVTPLSDLKARNGNRRPSDDADEPVDDESGSEPESRPEPEKDGAKATPAGSGETHQPRTGADIDEAGSLFDL